MKRFLFLVIAILGLYNFSFGQGTNCADSEILCDPNTSFPAAIAGPDLGSVSCADDILTSSPRAAFYTLFVAAGGVLDLTITNSGGNDLDFAIWGPFPDLNVPCNGNFPDGPVADCSYSTGATELAQIASVQTGEVYILMVTNFGGASVSVELITNGPNTAVLGGPLAFDLPSTGPHLVNSGVQDLETTPPSTDPSVIINAFSGTGITDPAEGLFDPAVAGIGTHAITVDGTSYGCPVTRSSSISVTNSITSLTTEVTRCNGNAADEALCPDETDDEALVDITVTFAAPISATEGLLLTDLLGNTITPTPIDITPGTTGLQDSLHYVFKDIAIPADGTTTFNFQADLYQTSNTNIIDTQTQAQAAENPCSCFQYACSDNNAYQALPPTGFLSDPDYTQEYILTNLAGTILERNTSGIFDITNLNQGTIYPVYGFSYLTADAAAVSGAATIDQLYDINDVDPCVDAAVSVSPCHLEIPPNTIITNADACDDINQITIDAVTRGFNPDTYCNATTNASNGSFPYTIFIDNDNDVTNGFITEADATATPVTFTSATYPALGVSEPTEFFAHTEDGATCIQTVSVTVYPEYDVTVKSATVCLSPNETVTTIPDYGLLTNLLTTPAFPKVNGPGVWSSPEIFITQATSSTAYIEAATLDAQVSGTGSTTVNVNYTTAPGTPCSATYGPFVLTLTRLNIPSPSPYTVCEGAAIPPGAGLGSDCGSKTNWYNTDGTSFMAQVPAGGFFDPFSGAVPNVTPGTYTYFMECVDANACTSDRIGVSLIITSKPSPPNIPDQTICLNGAITDINPVGGTGSTYNIVGPSGTAGPLTVFGQADLQPAGLDETTAGTYNFQIAETNTAGCAGDQSDFNIIVSPQPLVSASADMTICDGSTTTLTANSVPSDAATTYTWYADMGLTTFVGSGASITVTPTTSPATYYVTSSLDGCVSASDNVVVTLTEPTAPTGTDATACENSTTLAHYELSANCTGGNVNWYDAATGGTLLLANSMTFTPPSPTTLPEGTYAYYAACEDINGCASSRTAVTLIISPKPDAPIIADQTICENGTATDILLTGGAGSSYSLAGPSGSAGPLTGTATNGDLTGIGLDATIAGTYNFSLTEISDANCIGDPGTFEIIVVQKPLVNASADVNACEGETVTLSVTTLPNNPSTVYYWYSDMALTTFVGTGANLDVFPSATTTYYVVGDVDGCVSSVPDNVMVTITSTAEPSIVEDASACEGDPVLANYQVSATCQTGEGVNWYDASTGGTLIGTSATYAPPSPTALAEGTYQYFASCVDANGCESTPRILATLTIFGSTTPTVVAGQTICENGTINTIVPTGESGSTFTVTSPTGGLASQTSFTQADLQTIGFDPATAATYGFTITETNANGCTSDPNTFDIIVNPEPIVNASADITVCNGGTTTLTASSTPANTSTIYAWYSDAGLTTSVGTGSSIDVTPTATTTYYVTADSDACVSTVPASVTVTVDSPAAATGTDGTACEEDLDNANYTISAACAAGADVHWYAAASGGTLLFAGDDFIPSNASSLDDGTHTYYAECMDANGCASGTRIAVTLTIHPKPDAPIITDQSVCEGESVNTITPAGLSGSSYAIVGASGTVGPLTSITEANLTTAGLDANSANDYVFTITEISSNNCTSESGTFTVAVNEIPLASAGANPTPICPGASRILNGGVSNGVTATSFAWYELVTAAADPLTDPLVAAVQNPTVSPSATTTYYLVVTSGAGCTSVNNPAITIEVEDVADPIVTGYVACEGDAAAMAAIALMADCTSPLPAVETRWYDADGNLVEINSATHTPPGASAFAQGTYDYFAECYDPTSACTSNRILVQLVITSSPDAPVITDETICEGDAVPTIFPQGEITGSEFDFYYNSTLINASPAQSLDLSTVAAIGANPTAGNYGIVIEENASGCTGASTTFTLTVNQKPTVTAGTDVNICNNEDATIRVTSVPNDPNTVYNWYEDINLTIFVGTGASITVTPSATTTYYVIANSNGCMSSTPDDVVVTITEPAAPTITDATACEGDTDLANYTLSATCLAGATINWYDAASGGNPVATGTDYTPANPTTIPDGNYTYYAVCVDANGCESEPRSPATLTIYNTPAAPDVADQTICENGVINGITPTGGAGSTFTVSGTGTDVTLQTSFDQGEMTTAGFDATTAGTYSFNIVEVTIDGCTGEAGTFDLTVLPEPVPTASADVTICPGDNTALTAASVPNNPAATFNWYSDAALTVFVGSGASLTVTPSATTTYYVVVEAEGCLSTTSDDVIVTVNNPQPPTGTSREVCEGDSDAANYTISAACIAGETVSWYDAAIGGSLLATGTDYTPPSPSLLADGTYPFFAACEDADGCESAGRTQILLTVYPKPDAPLIEDQTICVDGTINDIIPGGNAGSSYTITGPGGAVGPLATFTQANMNTAGFDETTTGTYSFDIIEISTNSCEGELGMFDLIVSPNPIPVASTDVTICTGDNAVLTVTSTPNDPATTFTWFEDMAMTAFVGSGASITVTPTATTTYYVTAELEGCLSVMPDNAIVTVNTPSLPTGTDTEACEGDSDASDYTINAACIAGETVNWYNAPTAGILLATGEDYTPPSPASMTDGTYQYYAVCEDANGCESATRTLVTLTIYPKPDAPVVADQTICEDGTIADITPVGTTGSTFTITGAGGTTGPLTTFTQVNMNTAGFDETTAGAYSFSITETTADNCEGEIGTFDLIVLPEPTVTTGSDVSICEGASTTLTAAATPSDPNTAFAWYEDAAMTAFTGTGTSITVSPTTTTTYYVFATIEACTSSVPAEITVTVATPVPPTGTGNTVCENDADVNNYEVSAACAVGETVHWYDAASGGNLLSTGDTYIPPSPASLADGTYAFYATCVAADACESGPRTSVTLEIRPKPDAPAIANQEICLGETIADINPIGLAGSTFTITGSAGNVGPMTTFTQANMNVAGFDENAAGDYAFSIMETTSAGCESDPGTFTLTVNDTPAASAGADPAPICPGDDKELVGSISNGITAAAYDWYELVAATADPSADPLVASTQNTTVTPAATTTYYLVVTSDNGCVSMNHPEITVTVNPIPDPIVAGYVACEGDAASMAAIVLNADCTASTVAGTETRWYDDAGNLVETNSATYTPAGAASFAAATYNYFATCYDPVSGCESTQILVQLVVTDAPAAPTVDDITICEDDAVPTIFPEGEIAASTFNFYYNGTLANASPEQSLDLATVAAIGAAPTAGNYEMVIEENAGGCIGESMTFTLTVSPAPTPIASADVTICTGDNTTLTVTSTPNNPATIFAWYEDAALTSFVGSGASLTVSPTVTTTYYVTSESDDCLSTIADDVIVTVNTPSLPTGTDTEVCEGDLDIADYTINAICTAGETVNWYDAPTAGTLLATGENYTPPSPTLLADGTYQFYAACEDANGCGSAARTLVTLIIYPKPDAPVVAGQTICEDGTITDISPAGNAGSTFTITGTAGSVGPSNTFTQASLNTAGFDETTEGTYTFNITETTLEGCEGEVGMFDLVVSPEPIVTASADVIICANDNTTLTVSSMPNDAAAQYEWYEDAGLTLFVGSGSSLTVSPTVTTTYYVTAELNACISTVTDNVVVTVNEPSLPTGTDREVCEGELDMADYTVNATCTAGETVNWYDAPTAGTLLATGENYTPPSPALLADGTYQFYAACEDANGCESAARTLVTLIIYPKPDAPVVASQTICEDGTIADIIPTGNAGSTFTITGTAGSTGPSNTFTQADLNTAGFDETTDGTHTFNITETTVEGCEGEVGIFDLVVSPEPIVTASADVSICAGENTSISAGADVSGTTVYNWTEQASGTFVSNDQFVVVSPSVTTIYEVTVEVDGCISLPDDVTVTVNTPGDITSTTDNTVACEGSTDLSQYELMATCAAETVHWYDAQSGGTLLGTGNSFTPANATALAAGSYNYYAQCIDAAGCTTGNRTAVLLVVQPIPDAPSQIDLEICSGDDAPVVNPLSANPSSVFNLYAGSTLLNATPASLFDMADYAPTDFDNATAGTYTYTLTEINPVTGCESTNAAFDITVKPIPVVTVSPDVEICIGESTDLIANTVTTNTPLYEWFISGTTGLLSTNQTFTVSPQQTTTYDVYVTIDGCRSLPDMVTVTINTPNAPTGIVDAMTCEGNTNLSDYEVSAQCGTNQVNWYDEPTGGTLLGTGNIYSPNNPLGLTPGTYTFHAECMDAGGCPSTTRVSASLTIHPLPDAPIVSDETICEDDNAPTITPIPATAVNSASAFNFYDGNGLLVETGSSLDLGTVAYFDNTTPGTYTFAVREVSGFMCEGESSTFTITVTENPDINVSADVTICAGEPTDLTAGTTTSGTTTIFEWYISGTTNFQGNGQVLTVSPATTTTYDAYVTVDDCRSELPAMVTVTVNDPAAPTTAMNATVCEGDPDLANYEISADCGASSVNWYDTATGGTAIGIGNTFTPSNALSLAPGIHTYYSECVDGNACSSGIRTAVYLTINDSPGTPTVANETICKDDTEPVITPQPEDAISSAFIFNFYDGNGLLAGTGPSLDLAAVAYFDNTTPADYDFTVREVNNEGCEGELAAFTITVRPEPIAQAGIDPAPICQGDSKQLNGNNVDGLAGTYEWYSDIANDGVSADDTFVSNEQNPIVTPAETTIYYLVVTSPEDCISTNFASVEVVVTPVADPIVENEIVCESDAAAMAAIELTATCGAGFDTYWYDMNGNLVASGTTTHTPTGSSTFPPGTYLYNAVCVDPVSGCASNDILVQLIIIAKPDAPTVADHEICESDTWPDIAPIGENSASVFNFYYQNSLVATSDNFLDDTELTAILGTPTEGDYTFFVREVDNNCESDATPFTITVLPTPLATVGPDQTICEGDDATISAGTATFGGTANYSWYISGTSIFIGTGTSIVVSPTVTTSYDVIIAVDGCPSLPGTVTVTVNPLPDTPIGTDDAVCQGSFSPANGGLMASCNGDTYWYDSVSGGNLLYVGATYVPADIATLAAGTYTYFTECMDASGCISDGRTPVTLIVSAVPEAPSVDDITICLTETIPQIIPGGSVANATFNLYYNNGQIFAGQTTFNVNGFIDTAMPGDYHFTATEIGPAPLFCEGSPYQFIITILGRPDAPAPTNDGPICIGDDAQLTVGTSANTMSYAWYDETPDYNDLSLNLISTEQNPVLPNVGLADAGEYHVLTYTQDGCPSEYGTTTLTVNNPKEPGGAVNQTICEGESLDAPLEVAACNPVTGTVTWWDAPAGGTQIGLGETYLPNFTNSFPDGTYHYYAQCEDTDGCVSTRTDVTLTVSPYPATPTISTNAPICEGDDLVLTTSEIPGATYEWIGPLGDSNGTLTHPLLTTTTNTTTIPPTDEAYVAGQWQVQITDASGCTSLLSDEVEVIIYPLPVAVANNNGPICNGEDAVLTAGGVDGATFEWFDDANTLISIEQEATISNVSASSTYELVVTVNGCTDTTTTTVIINDVPVVNPTLAYTPNEDCSLGDIELDAAATGTEPLAYAWTGPNQFASTEAMVTIQDVTTAANGTYSLIVTDTNGCTAESSVSINNIPDPVDEPMITSSAPTCEGNTVTISIDDYSGSAVSYEWSFNGNPLTQADVTGLNTNQIVISPVATAAHEGDYAVTINIDGCTLTSDIYTLDVYDQPTVAPSYTTPDNCEGSTITFMANATNTDPATASYSWMGPGGFTSNARNPVLTNMTFDDNGTYTITVTTASGCKATATVEVDNIQETPATPIITSNSPVCINADILLNIQQEYTGGLVEYVWYNGAGTIMGTEATVSIPATDPVAISPYTVMVTVDGCETEISTAHPVQVDPLPLATATNNGPVCENGNVDLLAAEEPLASYEWRDENGLIISTDMNPTITGLTETTTYELTVISENGCVSNPLSYTTVEVNPLPVIANITGGGTYCEGEDVTLSAMNTETTDMTMVTYTWTGPNSFSYTDITAAAGPFDLVLPNVNATDEGTYTLTITSDEGCIGLPTSVNVVINDEPETPVLTAAGNLCKGEDLTLTIGNPYNGTQVIYEWYHDNTGSGFPAATLIGSSNTPNFILYDIGEGGTGNYYVIVTVDGCDSSPSNAASVTVTNPPMPTPSVINGIICQGEDIALLAGGTYEDYIWTGPNGFSSSEQNPLIENAATAASGTYELMIYTNGCISDMSIVNVIVTPLPATPTITNNGPLCEGDDLVLTVTSPVDNGSTTYAWYDTETNAQLGVTSTPNLTVAAITSADAGEYHVVLSSAFGCESVTGAGTTVNIFTIPANAADAGTDIETCGIDGNSLDAVAPTVGTGMWTALGAATIDNPNSANSTIHDLQIGDNVFVWTLSNEACTDYDSDTVTVIVTPPTTDLADAGGHQVLCLADGEMVTLEGSVPASAGVAGIWTQTLTQASLGVVIESPSDPNTDISGITESYDGASYAFTWTYSNGACGNYSADIVEITIYSIPANAADAGEDIEICGGSTVTLDATTPSIGTGMWTSTSAATMANPDLANTEVLDLDMGENIFVWTLSNGICGDYDTDTMIVNVTNPSADIAYAGDNQSLCGEVDIPDGTISLEGSVPTEAGAVGTWTQPSEQNNLGITITDPNDPNTTVTGLFGTLEGYEYTFTWTLGNGACGDFSTDEVSVTVFSIPTNIPFLGDDVYSCGNDTYELFANELPGIAGIWSTDVPGIQIISPESASTIVTGLTVGENEFYYSISAGSCGAYARDTILVIYELAPEAVLDDIVTELNTPVNGINVIGNDDFFGVGEWTISVIQEPVFGELTNYGDGTFDYLPLDNFLGSDEFIYEICNADCPELCDIARAVISVSDNGDCLVPTIFTPNGDGVNDRFIVNCLADYPGNELVVFNRWGDEVYRETNYANSWEGTYDNETLPEGTYYYILLLNDPNNTVYKGFVMVKR